MKLFSFPSSDSVKFVTKCGYLFYAGQDFRPATLLKRDFNTGVSCEICKIFEGTLMQI